MQLDKQQIESITIQSTNMAKAHLITAEEEYRKDSNLKKGEVDLLRKWLLTQSNLPHGLTDESLLLYIHCCEYNLVKAKQVIQRDWGLRAEYPELLADLDPCTPEQENIWSLAEFWISRETTLEGYRAVYAGLHNYDSRKYNFLEAMKAAIMVIRADLAERGTCPGFVFILNAKGTSFGHILKASLTIIRAFLMYAQEGNPIIMKAIHIIHVSYIVDKMMILTRPFIGKPLYDLIKLHPGDMQTFFDNVTENVLPSELGGTAGTLEELRNAAKHNNLCYRDYFLQESKLVIRKKNSKNYSSNMEKRSSSMELD